MDSKLRLTSQFQPPSTVVTTHPLASASQQATIHTLLQQLDTACGSKGRQKTLLKYQEIVL